MSQATQAVSAVQPVAEWQAERGRPRDTPATPPLLSGATAAPTAGRVLDLALETLLEALPPPPGGAQLREVAMLAGQRGLTLAAVVLEKSSAGLTPVAVGESRFLLPLPLGLKAGETVSLQLLPRLPDAVDSLDTELGATARLISRLLAGVQDPRPISSTVPLATAPGDAPQIAAQLRQTLRSSGLFYESHLADWVAGAGSRADLLREPQAALLAATSDPAGTGRLAPQAEILVQRQLDVLERGETVWQGQVWPGQGAELHIAQDSARNAGAESQRTWQAVLRLSFTGLGEVEAKLSLHGNAARVDLRASDPVTARRLQAGHDDFVRALAAQGLLLSDAKVTHAGPA